MKSNNFINSNKWPNKIIFMGENYRSSKGLSLPELAFMIEADLLQLANTYDELTCHFDVKLIPCKEGVDRLQVSLVANSDALMILQDEVHQIVESYNKQLLVRESGVLRNYYCRFYYDIEFQHKNLFPIKGGRHD